MTTEEDWEIIYAESIKKDPPIEPKKELFYKKIKINKKNPKDLQEISISEFRKDYQKLIAQFY